MIQLKKLWSSPRNCMITIFVCLLGMIIFCYASVELTSTPTFCGICHEMQPALESWQKSSHYAEGQIRADCRDCHIPPWSNPFAVLWVKITHGTKDLYYHFGVQERIAKDPAFYIKLKNKTLKSLDNSVCLQCHESILVPFTQNGPDMIQSIHVSSVKQKISCVTCHLNSAHRRQK